MCLIDTRSPLRPKYLGHVPGVDRRISRIVKVHLLSGGTHIITSAMNSKVSDTKYVYVHLCVFPLATVVGRQNESCCTLVPFFL